MLSSLLPDLVLTNGRIITVDDALNVTEALAVKWGKILAVGTNEEIRQLIGKKTRVLDLKKNVVIPGINDSHMHLSLFGLSRPPLALDLSFPGLKSIRDVQNLVHEKVKEISPGQWVEGWGWNENFMEECLKDSRNRITRHVLDAVSPANPVCLTRFCGHVVWANSKALDLARVTDHTPDPVGGEIERELSSGRPTGILIENAASLVRSAIPPPSETMTRKAIISSMNECNALGITSVTDATVDPALLASYHTLQRENKLSVRINTLLNWTGIGAAMSVNGLKEALCHVGTPTNFGNAWLKIGGIKIFADGIPSRKTSWEYEEFVGGGHGGLVVVGDSDLERYTELVNMIVFAHKRGFQVGVHACGARAIDTCVDGCVKALGESPRDARHYVIHGNTVPPETVKRMAKHGIGMNIQMIIKHQMSNVLDTIIGRERSAYTFPVRTLMDAGVHVVDSSDAPVTYPDWRLGIQMAILRESKTKGQVSGAEQCISPLEALRMRTVEAAWQDHMELQKGSIAAGKLADFCVLGDDILVVDPHKIGDIPILMTIVEGRIVYNADEEYLRLK